ncbi:uncharacterized protein LOC131952365 [Physella acuta]|uniref:uncharacterized protein LOC131952365 n=1 Tax=Physella acuta TaxID=109671 RepID=UPI0027DBD5D7|nr:uncharacterized protein LOC131952365 [Physella acuta]XP_059170962.1 uncharacterized protein LOC131952365 [Physella acuta]
MNTPALGGHSEDNMCVNISYVCPASNDDKHSKNIHYDQTEHHTIIRVEPSTNEVNSFAMENHQKNTTRNPMKEATSIAPVLIRRTESNEILPKPFTKFSQLIVCSYLSMLCCCICGAMAVKRAVHAKIRRNQGVYVVAQKKARQAGGWILAAVLFGLSIGIIIAVVVSLKVS